MTSKNVPMDKMLEFFVKGSESQDIEELESMQVTLLEEIADADDLQVQQFYSNALAVINARIYQQSVVVLQRE